MSRRGVLAAVPALLATVPGAANARKARPCLRLPDGGYEKDCYGLRQDKNETDPREWMEGRYRDITNPGTLVQVEFDEKNNRLIYNFRGNSTGARRAEEDARRNAEEEAAA